MRAALQTCLDLFHHPRFKELYHRTNEELLSWAQFRELPMPDDFTAEEVWLLLSAMRRLESHVFPFRPYTHEHQPRETWCSLDNHIGVMLKELVAVAAESDLSPQAQYRYQYLRVLSEDIAAAALRDGITLDREAIQRIVMQQTPAQTDDERLAKNAAEAILSIERYAKYPFTPWMLEDFVAHLDATAAQEARADEMKRRFYAHSPQSDEQISDTIFASANDKKDSREVYLLDLTSTSTILWDLSPFPRWNALIEVFLRHWALERHGMSVLRFVPFSRLGLVWDLRCLPEGGACDPCFELNPDIGEEHDATSFFGNVIRLFLEELHHQLDAMGSAGADEANAPDAEEAGLNFRQRDILRNLLANPGRRLTIQMHMNLYGVSYGTARTDLLTLADKGLLTQTYAGRAMVFTAARDGTA